MTTKAGVKKRSVAKNVNVGSVPGKTSEKSAADAVDAQLAKYRSMRDFHITAEPAGQTSDGIAEKALLPFCIQKHAASHLHYDFRLGWKGVLKSWAVAKGPSYFVGDKRLAVEVEDHPMEYGGFEGIIPAGQYGGGTVMLWDQGTWEPQAGHTDVDMDLRDGQLKFVMHGTKMKGRWALIRMGGRAATERKPNWLLIKEHDEFERARDAEVVTEAESLSVVTGRDLEQISRNGDHVWNSKETAGTGQAWYRKVGHDDSEVAGSENSTKSASEKSPKVTALGMEYNSRLQGLPKETQPGFLKPQLASEGSPPEGKGWIHELKLDGYRIQARKDGAAVQMLTRRGLDWANRVPAMAQAVARLPVHTVTLDGEVVVLRKDGTTNFADLQASFQEGAHNPLTYFCFDLLHLEGRDTRGLPLAERKAILIECLAKGDKDEIRVSEHLEGSGAAIFQKACELHAEGIVSKRAEAPYRSGRGEIWVKSKCLREQEFVVGGFTYSSDGEDRIGSLLLGYYDEDGRLMYAGRAGTGFTQKMRRILRDRMGLLRVTKAAYQAVPPEAKRGAIWVRPELVAQVRFATWTAEDLVRQAAFLGLREDKAAKEVRREGAEVAPKPKIEREHGRRSWAAGKRLKRTAVFEAPGERSSGEEAAPSSTVSEVEVENVIVKFYVRRRTPKNPATVEAEHMEAKLKAGSSKPFEPTANTRKTRATTSIHRTEEHAPVRLTHPHKLLDASSGVTKQMLADFYWAVADRMLLHISGRPLSLVRCPEGAEKPCFFQKHVNHMLPKGIGAVPVPDKRTGVPEDYITLSTTEALAGLAQIGVLEVHPWGSRNTDLERPDRLVFDLDPDETLGWNAVAEAAADVRNRLKAIGLKSLLKTTGGKGLHVIVPIAPEMEWPAAREFTYAFVRSMERARPDVYLTKMTKAARAGKIYLDYLRNERGATAVAPYSPRARAGMEVSVPLAWSDLKLAERPVFRVSEFLGWMARLRKDPWAGINEMQQTISVETRKAIGMKG